MPMRKKPPDFSTSRLLGQVQRVIVAVPGEEAAVAELGGERERRVVGILIPHAHRERRASVVEAFRIGDSVDFEAGNLLQAGDHPLQQSALVCVDS